MADGAGSIDSLELRIKTLDAQEFAVQVSKSASVPDLKQKVAEAGGCPVESQRLIYRGRVLKDDHLVSEYNIGDGHVLHLVARQPPPQIEGDTDEDMPGLEDMVQQEVTSHILGSISIDGAPEGIPNLNQILSSVFSSLGLAGGLPAPAVFPPLGQAIGAGAPGDVETRTIEMHFDIPNAAYAGGPFPPARAHPVAMPSRAAGPAPRNRTDSLSTMSSFLRHLERRMQAHNDVLRQHGPSTSAAAQRTLPPAPLPTTGAVATAAGGTGAGASGSATPSTVGAQGDVRSPQAPGPPAAGPPAAAPGPQGGGQAPGGAGEAANASRSALLAGLLGRTQTLLQQQADPLLSIMHERLQNEAAIVDPGDRGATQADFQIGGSLLQGLGALLLELGRAARAVNLNTEPGQASVAAAPPAYISNSSVLLSSFGGQPPNAGIPLPQAPLPQPQAPVVFQVQSAAPPMHLPGPPAQVVLHLPQQQPEPHRAFMPGPLGGNISVQFGDPRGGVPAGGPAVGPNGGVMMQLLPNGTLAPLQGVPPSGSVFVGSVPRNATTATLQQAYAGAQAAQQQQPAQAPQGQQALENQHIVNMLGSLFGAVMQPQGGAALQANDGNGQETAQGAEQTQDGPGRGRSAGGAGGANFRLPANGADPRAYTAQQARPQSTGAAPVGRQGPGVTLGAGPISGAQFMSMIGPVLQQMVGGEVNVGVVPGVSGPQQQQQEGSRQPGQQMPAGGPGSTNPSPFRFPAPSVRPPPAPGPSHQPPAMRSFTVTQNVPIPGGHVRSTTTTVAISGQHSGEVTASQGGQNEPARGAAPVASSSPANNPPASTRTDNGPGDSNPSQGEQRTDPVGEASVSGVPPTRNPGSTAPVSGEQVPEPEQATGGPAGTASGEETLQVQKQEKESAAAETTAGEAALSGGRGAPAGLGGAGLQPLPSRCRRRPAPRSEQQGRDGLAAISQMLQGVQPSGPSRPSPGNAPPVGDIMGSVMQAMGGQGGGGGLGGMLGQLMNNPGVDRMMRQVMGDEGGAADGAASPDFGGMMSQMMPMVAQMLGGGGGNAGRAGGVRQRQADGEEGWQEALSEDERARWEAVMARDEEAQAGAGPQRPLSDVYLRGSPAKRQRTGLDGTAFLVQNAERPEEVLESMGRTVRSELAKEGEGAFGEGVNEGLVSHVAQSEGLAEAYLNTLVGDAIERAENDPDFGDGERFPKTKEALARKESKPK